MTDRERLRTMVNGIDDNTDPRVIFDAMVVMLAEAGNTIDRILDEREAADERIRELEREISTLKGQAA